MTDRCPVCDRETCTATKRKRGDRASYTSLQQDHECKRHAVDWRARCLAAEAERDRIRALAREDGPGVDLSGLARREAQR